VTDLERRIGYVFRDPELRAQALTHRSYRHENRDQPERDNERLEFLGDSILGFVIARMLFERCPDHSEGELSRLRSHLVSAHHLAGMARELELGRELRVGRGEEKSGGRAKESILADAFESLLAALFLDGGLAAAEDFVRRRFAAEIEPLVATEPPRDFKSYLQEALHAQGRSEPDYHVVEEAGPDHHKLFEVAVEIEGAVVGRGIGRSKKTAQQAAARAAVQVLGL
jgi:ribonuclease-3